MLFMQVQHYVLYPEANGAVLPRQRDGFKSLAMDEPADEPAENQGGWSSLSDAGDPVQHRTLIINGEH